VDRDSIWMCFTVVATLLVDQNRRFGCHVLVVPRNNVKHSANGMLVEFRPSRRIYAIWKNFCSRKRWTPTRKSRAWSPECLEMHDEKRPKWRKAESGCGAPAMQERSPDSRDRGGCVDAIAPSADRETETQDGLNSTRKIAAGLYSSQTQVNRH
jgi:hypothetical protein